MGLFGREIAILEITDKRARDISFEERKQLNNNIGLGSSLLSSVADMASSALGGLSLSFGGGEVTSKKFYVQFNPSSLQIYAQGGGRALMKNAAAAGKIDEKEAEEKASKQEKSIMFREMPPRIQLTVPLIFDNTNVSDAFMFSTSSFNPLYAGISAASSAINFFTGKTFTVQPQVEGFLAALRSPDTSEIRFTWGDLSYEGSLLSVSSRYTMFSTSGRPIRATVDIGILMVDDTSGNLSVWKDAYETAFVDDKCSDYMNSSQKVGSMLNIGF